MPTPILTPPAHVARADSPAQKRLTKLADLANRTGRLWYERARLASELVADREWVDSCGGEDQAYEELTEKYFPDLFGLAGVGVSDIVNLFRRFEESVWVAHRWSLRRLQLKAIELDRTRINDSAEPGESGRPTRKLVDDLTAEKERLTRVVKNRDEQLAVVTDEAATLRHRLRQLELENAALKGRIEQLERGLAARG